MNSIADPAVTLKLLLDAGSVKQAQDQLAAGIKAGVDRAGVDFERIEHFLTKAISKAPIEAQLRKQFDGALRGISQGNFAAPVVDNLQRIGAAFATLGEQAMASYAKQAEVIAKFGQLGGRIDVHPSWQNAKTGQLWRRVHEEEHFLNSTATAHARQMGGSGDPEANRLRRTANEQDVDRRVSAVAEERRLDAVYAADAQSRVGRDPATAFAMMDLGDREEQGRAIHQEMRQHRERLASGEGTFGHSSQDRLEARLLRAQLRDQGLYDLAAGVPLPGRGGGSRMSNEFSHRFRFGSQNLAFGIDDAIQSYHYGGVGASIRAASNNATAIAGMTISNPMIAAGSVVALSIASAVAPMLLKKMGFDEDLEKMRGKVSDTPYSRDGSSSGLLRRGGMTADRVKGALDKFFSLSDQENANNALRTNSQSVIDSYSLDSDNVPTLEGEQPLWRSKEEKMGTLRGRAAVAGDQQLANFDKAVKWLEEDQKNVPLRQAQLDETAKHFDFLVQEAPSAFKRQELQRVVDRKAESSLYHAETTKEYNDALKASRDEDMLLIGNSPMAEHEKIRSKALRDIQYKEALHNQSGNLLTVRANVRERDASLRNDLHTYSGLSNPFSDQILRYKANSDSIEERRDKGILTPEEATDRLIAVSKGFMAEKARNVRNYTADSFGGMDSLQRLTSTRDDRREALESGMAQSPIDAPHFRQMMEVNEKGFQRQRADLMTSMKNDFKVTTPIGKIADEYASRAKKYQEMFEANPDMSAEERATLSSNLQKSFNLSMREANKPGGTERFTADAMVVGGQADRELQARMLGTFVKSPDDSYKEKSLAEFQAMAKSLGVIEEKLETQRLGL